MAASFAALLDEQIEKVNTFYTERVEEGVMLLSGFSPALMKFILSGEMEEERVTLDAEGAVVKTRTQLDPKETLRRVLDDTGLDAVRAVLDAVDPAALPGASWLPPL